MASARERGGGDGRTDITTGKRGYACQLDVSGRSGFSTIEVGGGSYDDEKVDAGRSGPSFCSCARKDRPDLLLESATDP